MGRKILLPVFKSACCGMPQHIVQARTLLANAEPFKDTKRGGWRQCWGAFVAIGSQEVAPGTGLERPARPSCPRFSRPFGTSQAAIVTQDCVLG